ncbi:hypothetical protein EON65_24690 [archaeon]|nr:MAG: hypothetical protein EON65_24690 [archaeon]
MKMRRIIIVVLISCLAIFGRCEVAAVEEKKVKGTAKTMIEHVIVLMMENRSFDHMLGYLKRINNEIDGCLPEDARCSNPADPADPSSPKTFVSEDAVYVQASPDHSIHGTTLEIFGSQDDSGSASMQGFISAYSHTTGDVNVGPSIMKCFNSDHLPILSNLSMEFASFDGYHASVPGPTMPNRAYAASASSHGMGVNDMLVELKGMPQKTMFQQLLDMGLDYKVYFQSVPAVLMFKDMRHYQARQRYSALPKFYTDVQAGDLPEFTWIEPNYFVTEKFPASDQHPDHDVSLGEELIKNVYEALRNSPLWDSSALIITYDEHGGFYDHVSPPDDVPSPDGINATDDPFDFTRLGVRVPFVVASPWVKQGQVVHAPASGGQYEHSSLAATIVHKLFGPKRGHDEPEYLNARDSWAATWEHIFTTEHRGETAPRQLPPRYAKGPGAKLTPDSKLTDLQVELVSVVAGAVGETSFDCKAVSEWTQTHAVKYISDKLNVFFNRTIVDML